MRTTASWLQRFLAAVLLALPAAALAQQAQEHEVKAAFLYKFPAFIEWPVTPDASVPFVIAIVGAAELASELRAITRGRLHEGRRIEVREPDAKSVQGADLVFVGRAAAAQLPQIARATAESPTLIVSEFAGALEQGSVINFVLVDGRMRFEVAVEHAQARRLGINARLLALAYGLRGGRS